MKVKSIHHQMLKCQKLESKALAAAGLKDREDDKPTRLVYCDPSFKSMTAEELRSLYGKGN